MSADENQEMTQEEYTKALENELAMANDKNVQMSGALSNASMSGDRDGNFLQYQLESLDLLDKLENFYRGKYIGFDEEGNQVWKEPEDGEKSKTLNNHGVSLMMEIVTKYIDKNTILSYYSEQRIYEILADLGDEITLVLFCNYEEMGMDNYFKKTKFRVLILTTLHLIESSYRRAIAGRAMEEINQSKIVSQSEGMGMRNLVQQKKKGFGFLNWGRG